MTTEGQVEGVLYRGDKKTKYDRTNVAEGKAIYSVDCEMLSLMSKLPNQEDAGKVMLHQVDFDPEVRQILPDVPTPEKLTEWPISADRHTAYEQMWRGLTYVGVLANTAMWLYW